MAFFFHKISKERGVWLGMLVKMGKESKIKDAIIEIEEDLRLEDLVVPEPPENKSEDINKRYKDLAGYILIKLFSLDPFRYNALLQLDYVYRFLGSINIDEKNESIFYIPQRIPHEQVSNIKRYLNGYVDECPLKEVFSIGTEVKICSGDLTDIRGRVVSLNDSYVSIIPHATVFSQVIKVPIDKCSCI